MTATAIKYAQKALTILDADEVRLGKIDQYYLGNHVKPYMPDTANQEYRDLAERAVTNWMPNLVSTPGHALFVDNYTRGSSDAFGSTADSEEWLHWKRSGMEANQSAIHDAALKFGHSFALTERNAKGKVVTKGLSTLRTVTLYEDPATDTDPIAAVYFRKFATGDANEVQYGKPEAAGRVLVWDELYKYELTYTTDDKWSLVGRPELHGSTSCPVTRFHAYRDLEGRTWGVVEPMIPIQDRINQTIFDLLVSQTYASFRVRWVTGMAPPMKMRRNPDDGTLEPELDADGNPIPDQQYLSAARFFYAEDSDVKFGDLEGTDLTGFIKSAELAVRHLSALSQTPPHFLLGEIANISAEALQAAETALSRKIEALRTGFGEAWERVMRIAAEIEGVKGAADDFSGTITWRDMGVSSLAQSADALGKFAESLDIPRRGLWSRVPKVSKGELARWEALRLEDDYERQLVERAVGRSGATREPATTTAFGSTARGVTDGNASPAG